MMNHTETIIRNFSSKREMVEFIHFLDVDEILIKHDGPHWTIIYNANRTTITIPEDDFFEVSVIS